MDIQIAIKEACNRVCPICLVESTPLGKGELDYDLLTGFLSTIDPGKFTGRIIFTGGEPLLHPRVIDLVEYTTSRGLITTVHTSGWDSRGEVEPTREFALNFLGRFNSELSDTTLQVATSLHSYQKTLFPRIKQTITDVLNYSPLMCLNMRYDPNHIHDDGADDVTYLMFLLMDILKEIGFGYIRDRPSGRRYSPFNTFLYHRVKCRIKRLLHPNVPYPWPGEIGFYDKPLTSECLLSIGRIQQLGFAARNRIGRSSDYYRPCSWDAALPYIHWDGNLYPCCSNVGITRMPPMGRLEPGLTYDDFMKLREDYFVRLRPYLESTEGQHPNECVRCIRRQDATSSND